LVAPVVEEKPAAWKVYLPKHKGGWYDFYTGKKVGNASGFIEVPVSMERIPVFVKAGAILPLADAGQHTEELVNASWEIRIYPGADGKYVVYEDEGTNYHYEKGQYSTFQMEWNDAKRELTLHPRQGSFPGMRTGRTLRIVKAGCDGKETTPSKEIVYEGKKMILKLN
jgi:alpha-D-xyloside xylohydrolase